MCNSEKSSVDIFEFFKFSDDKPEFSSETASISLPNFDDEDNTNSKEKETDKQNEVKSEANSLTNFAKEEEDRRTEFEARLKKHEKEIIESAKKRADEILNKAEAEAVEIKEKAYSQATEAGYNDGYSKAYEENKAKLDEETACFLIELRDLINEYKAEKERLISQSIDELKDVVIAIAEKVIHVSLKTSGDLIKKMIISATEKMRYKEWAKIYISKNDSSLLTEGNTDLLRALSHLSEHIKITVMEDAAQGTCIIELPDQIIDASAATQLENIRGILKGASAGGGNDSV